ncbi:MAG: hypothetical protein IKJ82_07110 [Oscillospiraceae bacterium]|nr:hypothetical protein [Oscillospiraceae bacterium]
MIFFLILGIACISAGLFNIMLAVMSMNPKNLITVPGKLVKKKGFKDYPKGRNSHVPNATEYTYAYEVNNKTYKLNYVAYTHSRNVRNSAPIVYLRGFPWIACERKFYADRYWFFGIVLILCSVSFFWICSIV